VKKLTIEFVQDSFEKYDYECLTKVYIDSRQKLKYVCLKGHKHTMSWDNWKQGYRCPTCADQIKPTIEFVKKSFEKYGYELLTKKYINNRQKLEYICSKGHRHSMNWSSWRKGHRCPTCFINSIKNGIDSIRKSFEKHGYQLLTKVYINSHQKLEYICPKGHRHSINWNSWRCGHRCPICWKISISGCKNVHWKGGISKEPYCQDWTKDLKEFVKERDGYKCLNPHCSSKNPDNLTVHHINYNKKSCDPENLITVCRSCNARANKDRNWHEAWYKAILTKRYGYNYGGSNG